MIMFRACPKCGGDVDATYDDDVYCIQCGNRPPVSFPGPRILTAAELALLANAPASEHPPCPKCASDNVVRLNKARPDYNTCYRCYPCGHIYSPNENRGIRRANVSKV